MCVIFTHQIFGFLAFLCTILAIGNAFWEVYEGSIFTAFFPREPGTDVALSVFLSFWSYIIVLNTLVPISLYVRLVLSGTHSNISFGAFGFRWRHCNVSMLMSVWRSSDWGTASSSTGTGRCITRRTTLPPRRGPPRSMRSWARSSTSSVTRQAP